MLKLDTPIIIGTHAYSHMLFVKGDFDLRVPYAELYPALVRVTGDVVLLGRWRLTDTGVQHDYTELLTALRLHPTPDPAGIVSAEQEVLVATLRTEFLRYLEGLEQIAIGLQADPDQNRLTSLKVALTNFPLACTFDPLGERTVAVEVIDERSPIPLQGGET